MNPFRYSSPASPADLIDRDPETELLLRRAFEANNSRLVAPRRYGKTSVLYRVIEDARSEGWAAVYVDFFGVLSLSDVADRIERAYATQLEGPLANWFAGVQRRLRPTIRAGGADYPVGLEVSLDPQAEPPLLDRLALPLRLLERKGIRTLVVFDEFQDVLTAKQSADATIRSEIQHQGDAASYIFSGSHVGMMRELFGDRRRAFYGQATPVDLSPLNPEDVAEFIASRFEVTGRTIAGAMAPILEVGGGHPQRTILLAHAVWDATPRAGTATQETWLEAFDTTLEGLGDELRANWDGLSLGQRRVLTVIAEDRSALYGSVQAHGGSRGGALQSALKALEGRGEVAPANGAKTGYRVVDPLFAAWIVAGRGSR